MRLGYLHHESKVTSFKLHIKSMLQWKTNRLALHLTYHF